ncbi:hypothetical protein ABD73_18115 [Brevibacillus laterosporus]|nr:hypothetical protein [Brevibacillus laterosporus]
MLVNLFYFSVETWKMRRHKTNKLMMGSRLQLKRKARFPQMNLAKQKPSKLGLFCAIQEKEGRGVIESAWGWVDKFDSTFKQIKLKTDEDFWWIPVEDVVSVEA